MSTLVQIRMNKFYVKSYSKGKYTPIREVVLVLDKPKYKRNNEGDVIRERDCEEVRFRIDGDENYDKLIEVLKTYKDSKEEDLK